MYKVDGKTKSVRELLKGVRYSIDYYQREYRWEREQIESLVNDLCIRFLDAYEIGHERRKVRDYGYYFLGSIIISHKAGANFIVDGQQRLTSLTLLLMFLRTLQKDLAVEKPVNVDELIVSEVYGERAFNLDVPDREGCMTQLFEGTTPDTTTEPESIQNLVARYEDVDALLPDELRGPALPYFIDWLTENVLLVEITAFSDDDAYTIFETMNDRGLELGPDELLKGFVLSNITDPVARNGANSVWRKTIEEIRKGDEDPFSFFVDWFRSKFATKIRERKKNAQNEDFDRIGTEFHRWFREQASSIGFSGSDGFRRFVNEDMSFFSKQYMRICEASFWGIEGLEHVRYVDDLGFTLYPMVLLAPLLQSDSEAVCKQKVRVVSRYIDIFLTRRAWVGRSNTYSTLQYAMFNLMKEIRNRPVAELVTLLTGNLSKDWTGFQTTPRLQKQNRASIHYLLARMTSWLETAAGQPASYDTLMGRNSKVKFEIEHILAAKPALYANAFAEADFDERRNELGGLLLLPKKFNASFGALAFEKKREHYNSQNLLARSLHEACYAHNPGFVQLMANHKLHFKAISQFGPEELAARNALYRCIAELVWSPALLAEDAEMPTE